MLLDEFDKKILAILSKDARISITDLSDRVGLSKTPCHARLKKLEQNGFILGYHALLDPAKLGREHIAFVEIKLSDTRAAALKAFNQAVIDVPEIEQCHMIAGGFDYLLKIRTEDISTYRRLLGETISALPYIAQTSTFVAMESVKDTTLLQATSFAIKKG